MDDASQTNLRVPGPTPMPPEVRRALSRQMINHRGPDYAAIQREVLDGLRHFYQTEQHVLFFAASGTGGLEAAVVNTISPGQPVLAVTIGVFGERFARIAETYGAHVHRVAVPWGEAARPEMLAAALEEVRPKAILLTCNETSTGVMNDIPALLAVIRQARQTQPLVLVDAISALGAVDLPMDRLGIDVLISGSQKAWMAPPGIAMLGVSALAMEAATSATTPRFYFDFAKQAKAQAKGQDAWTPAVSVMYALQAALRLMRAEGTEAIVARHQRIASLTQRGLEDLGFSLFAEPGYRSRTVTAARPPRGIDTKALTAWARTERQVVLAGGQDRLEGNIIRVGHMGWVEDAHIAEALDALRAGLEALGSRARSAAS